MTAEWHEIQTKGFVVVPSFLSPGECEELVAEFRGVANDPTGRNPNYNLRSLRAETRKRLKPRILAVAAQVAACTTTKVDVVRGSNYYASELGIKFPWHNDHDSYFFSQDFINYLNYWIPIQKPDKQRSGICLAPFDALTERFPELATWASGNGSIVARQRKDRTIFYDSDRLESFEIPGFLDEVAATPEVAAGDLIVMRGDLLHRTQDLDTDRIAISLRTLSSQSTISRSRMTQMGYHKFNLMAAARMDFAKRLATFEIANKDVLKVAECEAIEASLTMKIAELCARLKTAAPTNEQFRMLVWECVA
jgi:hypothetical protein